MACEGERSTAFDDASARTCHPTRLRLSPSSRPRACVNAIRGIAIPPKPRFFYDLPHGWQGISR